MDIKGHRFYLGYILTEKLFTLPLHFPDQTCSIAVSYLWVFYGYSTGILWVLWRLHVDLPVRTLFRGGGLIRQKGKDLLFGKE
ncbi:MAG: hypothetical protein P4L27_03155 [Ignavibacteriaceae bacterium]|nr:hypothetical protein [Ignavibacteriaceae bacterium]